MRRLVLALVALLLLAPAPSYGLQELPVGTGVDYQLGGNRGVPAHVGIVVRDRTARPAGRYDVCYVNGFQTQPGEKRFWQRRRHLLLQDGRGRLVEDEAWGEWLLDLRTPAERRALARIVGRWTAGCARDGYEAVEFDNLDSFTRSSGLIRRRHAVAYARLLIRAAHRAGLAVGQKNLAGLRGTRLGFDFAVAEECGRYDECSRYTAVYGRRVLMIEYRRPDFERTCAAYGAAAAVVLRDRDLSPDGVRAYCPR
ncbi:endo alpha-1,4 polygalactosaminidase [Nocardioides sp. W7]|uniref:endo alpha-1,4 polygalactosaminidase n=1 Tax=Nocardioides sp. W7 TaxID=2931390 RepID=UPI001FD075C1|nr:endo alpha-1,4 polygalactosaminidase [Nocardioides sp. W7]